ncbi:MAG TPA: class I SAM-dependent methyltransferase, partial [Fluviicoccus sp.]|nr:class I SAM-dependent methyltransferase [Fluviicoccus sp.]
WHADHHRRPKALLSIPIAFSAPLIGLVIFLPLLWTVGLWRACAMTLGIISGYTAYSVTHYATHHWRADSAWLKRRKQWHLIHHLSPQGYYGVTSSFWDRVFGSANPHERRPDASRKIPILPEPQKHKAVARPIRSLRQTGFLGNLGPGSQAPGSQDASGMNGASSSRAWLNAKRLLPPLTGVSVTEAATTVLNGLFQHYDGCLHLQLWDGTTLTCGAAGPEAGPPDFVLVCRSAGAVADLALGRDPLRLAEAYFRNDIDIEGDFFAATRMRHHLNVIRLPLRDRLSMLPHLLRLHAAGAAHRDDVKKRPAVSALTVRTHSTRENLDAVTFHYDVSNAFYGLWLDNAMIYSCAYFEEPDDDLDRAQMAKLDHICRKLMLRPGERLLDIGCGWGALLMHAARYYGVHAHGITLSPAQFELAGQRIAKAGLQDLITIELGDYRDLAGDAVYDKICSVGMFEHVGLKNLPVYFAAAHRLLKPGGLFLNHGISHDVEGWSSRLSSVFINRYVFPDGQLDTISNAQRTMESAGFEIADVESLRAHYGLTLRHWVSRLERRRTGALRHVNESTWRVWRLYMAASAQEFESGGLGLYQVLAAKRNGQPLALPLTRRHQYL